MASPPASYTKTPVPTAAERHMLNRMGTGFSSASLQQMRRVGGPVKWFEQQLVPNSIPESAIISTIDGWFADQRLPAARKWQQNASKEKSAYDFGRELGCWTMLRRIHSTRPVLESMVGFWSDHLHVPAHLGVTSPGRHDYDGLLRKHAMGKFEDMLVAVSQHPAMLLFLDNSRSVRGKPNENHGRELLELHTVGIGAGYSEAMVRSSALLLSGWTVDYPATFRVTFEPSRHTTGPVQVLGFSDANALADGRALSERYLRYLARHPATGRRIATKLAHYFISETPSIALVDRLAHVFTSSGTDIKATLRALIASPEFQASAGGLVRTPVEDIVATARVLRPIPTAFAEYESYASLLSFAYSGDKLYMWGRPDGPPRNAAAVCNPARMLKSSESHWRMAGSRWPNKDVRYRAPGSWLPKRRIRFDRLVDHLSRVLLGRRSTPTLLAACIAVTGVPASTKITRTHPVVVGTFERVASCFLDSPEHMSR